MNLSLFEALGDNDFPVKTFTLEQKNIHVGSNAKLILPSTFETKFHASIVEIRKTIEGFPPSKNPITIQLQITNQSTYTPARVREIFSHSESYWIQTQENRVNIVATDNPGALYALITLENLLREHGGIIPTGEIKDWPSMLLRGFLLVPGPGVRISDIKNAITAARHARMNALFLYINKHIAFKTLEGISPPDAISLHELREIAAYARESALEVIPVVNLLTRQSHGGLLLHAKQLGVDYRMYNEDTYDPEYLENYRFVFSFLDEIIDQLHPNKIHIGHSEVLGCYPKHRTPMEENKQRVLPAKLFLKDVLTLYDFLKKKNIETWMWGDMLISQAEFPDMYPIGVNGNMPGYGELLRKQIPKDVVICDWHYEDKQSDFPSAKVLAGEGFRVVGATWKNINTTRNFSHYMAEIVDARSSGMIAGVWDFWKMEWTMAEKMIKDSGDAFWSGK